MKPRSRAARAPLGVLSWEHVYIVFLPSCLWVRGGASCSEARPGKKKESSRNSKQPQREGVEHCSKVMPARPPEHPQVAPKWLQNGSKMPPKSLPEAPREPKRNV